MPSKLILSSVVFLIILIIYLYYKYNYPDIFHIEYNHLSIDNVIKSNIENKNKQYKKNKENAVFFLSFDYTVMPPYYNQMLEVLTKYCKFYNNKLYIFDHSNDENKISPYWNRVADFIKLSKLYDNKTIIVYLDIDTIINSKYFKIPIIDVINKIDEIENKISDIYIGNDPSPTEFGNVGIIIIRNTEWSKKFLNLWWSKYNPNSWILNNKKWICKIDNNECPWAGIGYEQGEFNIIYRNNEINAREHINIIHYSLFSNPNILRDGFIYHFYGRNNFYKNKAINYIYKGYKFD
jgi:hypothetical protein